MGSRPWMSVSQMHKRQREKVEQGKVPHNTNRVGIIVAVQACLVRMELTTDLDHGSGLQEANEQGGSRRAREAISSIKQDRIGWAQSVKCHERN